MRRGRWIAGGVVAVLAGIVGLFGLGSQAELAGRHYTPAFVIGRPEAPHNLIFFWSPTSVASAQAYRAIFDQGRDLVNDGKLAIAMVQFAEPRREDMELARMFLCVPVENYASLVREYLWAYGRAHRTRLEDGLVTNDLFAALAKRFGAPEDLKDCASGGGATARVADTVGFSKLLHVKTGIAAAPTIWLDGQVVSDQLAEALAKLR